MVRRAPAHSKHLKYRRGAPKVLEIVDEKAAEMESPTNEEDIGSGDLIQDVYVYLTERRYPLSCTEARKRSIRRKAEKFVIREGELYFIKKKKKGRDGKKVNVAVVNDLRIGGYI